MLGLFDSTKKIYRTSALLCAAGWPRSSTKVSERERERKTAAVLKNRCKGLGKGTKIEGDKRKCRTLYRTETICKPVICTLLLPLLNRSDVASKRTHNGFLLLFLGGREREGKSATGLALAAEVRDHPSCHIRAASVSG